MGGHGLKIIDLVKYFYADGGIVASNQLESLHREFEVLTGLFNRFDLLKNTANMVGMVFQPCHASGGMLEEAYKRRTTGKGPTFWELQRRRVE